MDALAFLLQNNTKLFPNVEALLKILVTIPVTTASNERTFSTLRRLKTYLRNTTREDRLNGLALLNIHREIPVSVDEQQDVIYYSLYIEQENLLTEISLWKNKWIDSKKELPANAVDALNTCSKQLLFPNVTSLIKILTLPVTTATPELTFFALKRLKTYLKNSTGKMRLTGLALMSVHRAAELIYLPRHPEKKILFSVENSHQYLEKHVFLVFGAPQLLLSDNGMQFANEGSVPLTESFFGTTDVEMSLAGRVDLNENPKQLPKIFQESVGEEISIENEKKKPKQYTKDFRNVTEFHMKEKIMEICRNKSDDLGKQVLINLINTINLVAAGGKYHLTCYKNLSREIPSSSKQSQGYNEKQTAFLKLCEYMENSNECQFSLQYLNEEFESFCDIKETYVTRWMKEKLQRYFGDRISITKFSGKITMITLTDTLQTIPTEKFYSEKCRTIEEERLEIVKAASEIIREDIRKLVFDGYNNIPSTKDEEHRRRRQKKIPLKLFLLEQLLKKYFDKKNLSTFEANGDANTSIVDTAILLANEQPDKSITIVGEDTDLLVLSIALGKNFPNLFFKKSERGVTEDVIYHATKAHERLGLPLVENILFIHAVNRCDTTSYPYKRGKNAALNVLNKYKYIHEKLQVFNNPNASVDMLLDIGHRFMLMMYGLEATSNINEEERNNSIARQTLGNSLSPKFGWKVFNNQLFLVTM
ncbi:hypothetical protein ILUMI_08635 [Ignelater luminosus]|uniref:HAT C-terminal dimerisation domain-containing protein n=1 Tax=Ignelater luminosus TaxID=2038154 RepID=A0A8K0GAG0_IGNLU|nr:hypothetical protein ILUMI_08635 [Ignelater luminosus]